MTKKAMGNILNCLSFGSRHIILTRILCVCRRSGCGIAVACITWVVNDCGSVSDGAKLRDSAITSPPRLAVSAAAYIRLKYSFVTLSKVSGSKPGICPPRKTCVITPGGS